ncbi:hypothetical protein BT93_L5579 [Corymbia citriodora subsp. variegata]|uniref:F-box domain-containing protein n=1 Tax=Corymbia citriodora subsp. variegata TaxID=360336 RepID=A0A8T0CUD6_CORYI|nr:hypothetical protein BT93_L5579 [Corymbia citriodora subsp. variegata]
MSNWGALPQDVLRLIAGRLDEEDFVAFGSVCASWRSACAGTYDARTRAPWLISFLDSESRFWSMSWARVRRAPLPSMVGRLCYQGWMITAPEGRGLRLFNPISGTSVELPGSETFSRVHKFALSSSPSVSDDYVVMVHVQPATFAFYRPRERAWTALTYWPKSQIMDLMHYRGRFVALDERCRVITFDPRGDDLQENRVALPKFMGWTTPHLVECSGSLLVVWHMHDYFDSAPSVAFRVHKVDLDGGTWTEVKSLGSVSVFLSYECSFSVELDAGPRLSKVWPNRIYFIEMLVRPADHKIQSYRMEDGKIETHPELMPWCSGTTPRWIQPSF